MKFGPDIMGARTPASNKGEGCRQFEYIFFLNVSYLKTLDWVSRF